VLKYELFRYNIDVAAYPVFVYVVSRAGRQADLPPCTAYISCCIYTVVPPDDEQ